MLTLLHLSNAAQAVVGSSSMCLFSVHPAHTIDPLSHDAYIGLLNSKVVLLYFLSFSVLIIILHRFWYVFYLL